MLDGEAGKKSDDGDALARSKEYLEANKSMVKDFADMEVVMDDERYRIQADRAGGPKDKVGTENQLV